MQKDLEKSLEVLTAKTETEWLDLLVQDVNGQFSPIGKF